MQTFPSWHTGNISPPEIIIMILDTMTRSNTGDTISCTVGKLTAEDIDLNQMCYQILESNFPLPEEVNGVFNFFKTSKNMFC